MWWMLVGDSYLLCVMKWPLLRVCVAGFYNDWERGQGTSLRDSFYFGTHNLISHLQPLQFSDNLRFILFGLSLEERLLQHISIEAVFNHRQRFVLY